MKKRGIGIRKVWTHGIVKSEISHHRSRGTTALYPSTHRKWFLNVPKARQAMSVKTHLAEATEAKSGVSNSGARLDCKQRSILPEEIQSKKEKHHVLQRDNIDHIPSRALSKTTQITNNPPKQTRENDPKIGSRRPRVSPILFPESQNET